MTDALSVIDSALSGQTQPQGGAAPPPGAQAAPRSAIDTIDAALSGKTQPMAHGGEPDSTWGDYGAQLGAGMSKGLIAKTLGAPADIASSILNYEHRKYAKPTGGDIVSDIAAGKSGDEGPYSNPIGGSEWIAKHFLPKAPQPKNEGERLVNEFGQGSGEALGMSAGAEAAGSEILKQAAGKVGPTTALIGGVSTVAGNEAANQTYIPVSDKYKPLVATIAGMAAGAPIAAGTALKEGAIQGATKVGSLVTRSGAEGAVGRELAAKADNPQAAIDALRNKGAQTPGVEFTAGQQADDMGVANWEGNVRQKNKQAFIEKEAAQNEKMTEHLESVQPKGDAAQLPEMIRSQKEGVEQTNATHEQLANIAGNAGVSRAEAAHEEAINNLRSVAPDTQPAELAAHFRAVRNSLDAMTLEAAEKARQDADTAKGTATSKEEDPSKIGQTMRAPNTEALANAKEAVDKLYAQVEKKGRVQVPSDTIAKAAKDIPAKMVEENRPMGEEEARLFDIAKEYPASKPLRNVRALRGSVLDEMARSPRGSAKYQRLNSLRSAIDDGLDSATEANFAIDKISLGRGSMHPDDALSKGMDDVLREHYTPDGKNAKAAVRRGTAKQAQEAPGTSAGLRPANDTGAAGAKGTATGGARNFTSGEGVQAGPRTKAPRLSKSVKGFDVYDTETGKHLTNVPSLKRASLFAGIDHDTAQAGFDEMGAATTDKHIVVKAGDDPLIHHPAVLKILHDPATYRPETINREHDVPYLGGSSNDGKIVYIDRNLPHELEANGQKFDPAKHVEIHERVEHALMKEGYKYERAHKAANAAEKHSVEADGLDWKAYQKVIKEYIPGTEHEKITNPPKDLFMKGVYPEWEQKIINQKAGGGGKEEGKKYWLDLPKGKTAETNEQLLTRNNLYKNKTNPRLPFVDPKSPEVKPSDMTFDQFKKAVKSGQMRNAQPGAPNNSVTERIRRPYESRPETDKPLRLGEWDGWMLGYKPEDIAHYMYHSANMHDPNYIKEAFPKGVGQGTDSAAIRKGATNERIKAAYDAIQREKGVSSEEAAPKAKTGPTPEAKASAAIGDLRKANVANREMEETFRTGTMGEGLAKKPRGEDYKMSDAEFMRHIVHPGDTGGEDIKAYLKAGGKPEALEDAFAHSFHKASVTNGELNTKLADKWIKDHDPALRELPAELRQRFENASTAQKTVEDKLAARKEQMDDFEKSAFAKFAKLDRDQDVVAHMASVLSSKDAATTIGEMAKSVRGNPDAVKGMKRAILESIFEKFLPEGGVARADKISDIMGRNRQALARIFTPGEIKGLQKRVEAIRSTGEDIGSAKAGHEAALIQAKTAGKAALTPYQSGILSKLIRVEGKGNVLDVLGSMFSGNNSTGEAARLMEAARRVPGGVEAVKKGVQEMIERDFTGTSKGGMTDKPEIARAKLATFFKDNIDGLGKVFSPEQIGKIRALVEDGFKINRSIAATKLKGGSDTFSNIHGAGGGGIGKMALDVAGAWAGHHVMGHIGGALTGGFMGHILGALKDAGMTRINQVRVEAAMNPKFAADLLERGSKYQPRNSVQRVANRLKQLSLVSALVGAQQK